VCDLRDRAMMLVLLDTGLRASELCSMRRDQIDWDTGHFTVVGKGNKERSSWLSPAARAAITTYVATRRDGVSALWYGRRGFVGACWYRLHCRLLTRARNRDAL
jgi:integrase/recombinase XerD